MRNNIHELYALESLANGRTLIHRLHPASKLLSTIVFVITVASFGPYALSELIPLVFYPTIIMALSETPYGALLKKLALALPFCIFIGISNIFFDKTTAFYLGGFAISLGVISFFTILMRTYLCVMSVLALVAVTPFVQISAQLRRFGLPGIFVSMLEMTYRYLGLLINEAYSMYIAYSLRSGRRKGVDMRHMGSFIGQLLLRSMDRAERIYQAMKCRGYTPYERPPKSSAFAVADIVFLSAVCCFCLLIRLC